MSGDSASSSSSVGCDGVDAEDGEELTVETAIEFVVETFKGLE